MMLDSLTTVGFIGPGGPEFLVVMLVLLLMFGAKDAPRIFRKLNEMLNSVRNTADGFKREIMYGDVHQDVAPPDDEYTDDYGGEYYDDSYVDDGEHELVDEDVERDYSDETFQNLEKDLEQARSTEEAEEPGERVDTAPEVEEDDAEKA